MNSERRDTTRSRRPIAVRAIAVCLAILMFGSILTAFIIAVAIG